MAGKKKSHYVCQECGAGSPVWLGKCPNCQSFNTMIEQLTTKPQKNQRSLMPERRGVQKLKDIPKQDNQRYITSLKEFNLTLGGGIVDSSLTLIGGEPGIGKSTLLLQVAAELAGANKKVVYVSGEESPYQVKLRAERLGIQADQLLFLAETDMQSILLEIQNLQPELVIIDSIQTVYLDEIQSAPGSVTQIRECTAQFMRIAKQLNVTIFLVGHVTKDGNIAGPKILEHMVDTVLYFEGERQNNFRILRTVKNRFGATNEIGVFEMQKDGLHEVTNPSELFMEKRENNYSGISVSATLEGSRPILVEVQSLLAPTYFGNPRRTTTGIETNRLSLILAVLEKRAGLLLQNQDVFLKAVAGLKIDDPGADLAIASCIASAHFERPISMKTVLIGELGLTGEIRRVSKIEERMNECVKIGFTTIIIPKGTEHRFSEEVVIEVANIREALTYLDLLKK